MQALTVPRLDRASHLRKQIDALEQRLGDATSLLVPVWRNKSLVVSAAEPCAGLVSVGDSPGSVERAGEVVWLGLLGERGCFAVDVSQVADPGSELGLGEAGEFVDLRGMASILPDADVDLLGFARGILHWHRHARHCGSCGAPTKAKEGGHLRECPSCDEKIFPRTDPAVMVLVTRGDRCLLARQPAFPQGMFSALAGFVEPGESIEQAAVRETLEEAGIGVTGLSYFRSQPWPYPASLMVGFFAEADGDEIRIDRDELEDARWFTRAQLESPQGFFYPPRLSLAHHMIRAFVERCG